MTEHVSKTIKGRTGEWEIVLGLEIHAQVASKSKLFSGAAVGFGAGPNEQVSLVDAAFPGMLPVINRFCVEQAVRAGLGLNAKINTWSRFDRKNYFYPDLPQGYQISQFAHPIVGEGSIVVEREDGSSFTVGIERASSRTGCGQVDPRPRPERHLCRPQPRRDGANGDRVQARHALLGGRCGLCPQDQDDPPLHRGLRWGHGEGEPARRRERLGAPARRGARHALRDQDVNSYRFIQQAIEYEARRQVEILEEGGSIHQETRLFDSTRGETRSMRSKEEAHDYRYFPDPDLLPLELDPAWVAEIQASLPELPDAKRARFQSQYGLNAYDAGILVAEEGRADYFEKAAAGRDAKLVANWTTNELMARLAKDGHEIEDSPIPPEDIAGLVELIETDVISSKIAKEVFDRMWSGEGRPAEVVEKHGLKQVTDAGAIESVIDALIAANPAQVEAVKAKPQAVGWFVGQVMKETQGKANPAAVNALLRAKLGL